MGLLRSSLRLLAVLPLGLATATPVDFNRDVRPILSRHCTSCHGGVKQASGVSFLQREKALGSGKSGKPVVVAGRPEASELLRRVLLPQALRISLPSVTNDVIAMFKDSSIVSVIALVELTKEFQIRAIDTGDYLGLGLMTAGIYFAMSWTASLGARRIERMLHHDHR